MSFKLKGKIKDISEVLTFDSGAKKISFQITTEAEYDNLYSFDFFKGSEYAKFVEDFLTKFAINETVIVEFNIRTNEYNGKFYTNLSAWKVQKESLESNNGVQLQEVKVDDLPF